MSCKSYQKIKNSNKIKCPICLDTYHYQKCYISSFKHGWCLNCNLKINKCPICRLKLNKIEHYCFETDIIAMYEIIV